MSTGTATAPARSSVPLAARDRIFYSSMAIAMAAALAPFERLQRAIDPHQPEPRCLVVLQIPRPSGIADGATVDLLEASRKNATAAVSS